MKIRELKQKFGLDVGQTIQDSDGVKYLLCNNFHGDISVLRLRDSVLFSGLGIYEILEKIGFEVRGNFHNFKKSVEEFRDEFGDIDFEIDYMD